MAVAGVVLFILSSVLIGSDSYTVTPFSKCYSKDSGCLKNYFQAVVSEAAKNGIPQLDIPVLDPVVVNDFRSSIPGWLDLELVEGVAQGLRSCVLSNFWLSFEKRYGSVELICDASVSGHYRTYSNSSLIRNLLDGDTIYGDGTGQVEIEKLKIFFDFNFRVERRGDDYFLNTNFDKSKFGIEILGGTRFAANNLYLGNLEASQTIVGLMNQYSKMILDATGLPVSQEFFRYIFDFTQRYLYSVPLGTYLVDNLSAYVERQFPWLY